MRVLVIFLALCGSAAAQQFSWLAKDNHEQLGVTVSRGNTCPGIDLNAMAQSVLGDAGLTATQLIEDPSLTIRLQCFETRSAGIYSYMFTMNFSRFDTDKGTFMLYDSPSKGSFGTADQSGMEGSLRENLAAMVADYARSNAQ